MSPEASVDMVVKRKRSCHYSCQELNPAHPSHSVVSMLMELSCQTKCVHKKWNFILYAALD